MVESVRDKTIQALQAVKDYDINHFMETGKFALPHELRAQINSALDQDKDSIKAFTDMAIENIRKAMLEAREKGK